MLPNVDLEMMYWRARRSVQRIRAVCRARASRTRAELHLRHLYLFGRRPERPEPEETFAYRAMWALTVAGLIAALVIDAVGEDRFLAAVAAVQASLQGERAKAVDLSADTDVLRHLKQPNA